MTHRFSMLMADCTERLHLQLFPMQLSRVGRIIEHALHKKFLSLGEVLSVHTNFQTLLITPAIEWSHSTDLGVSAPPPNRDGNFAPPRLTRPSPLRPVRIFPALQR